jgi:hypothetical protein
VQRPRGGYDLKTCQKAIKEPDEEITQSPKCKEINSESFESPKKQEKILIKKYPFDMTKSLFSSETFKTMGTIE